MTNINYLNWKRWDDADFGAFTREEALYYAAEIRKSGIGTISGLRVAELGFGNGGFAGWTRQAGGKWVGREENTLLQARALKAGYEVVAVGDRLCYAGAHGSFDLIVAFDVLEHLDIDSINSFLLESKNALKLGGSIILRIPSGDSPFSGAIYYGDLTHRTLLGSSAIRQIAENVGLKLFQVRGPVLPILGLGILRAARRLPVFIFQWIVFFLIRNFIICNSSAVVSLNMVVVLRKDEI